MAPKSSSDKSRLASEDFNEGPQAASRFLAAASQLFKVSPHHHAKSKTKPTKKRRK